MKVSTMLLCTPEKQSLRGIVECDILTIMVKITSLLPHRKPFLFVDRIESADASQTVGYKRFEKDEAFFAGHFPDYPVVPGVILIETMAQCGGAGMRLNAGAMAKDELFFLAAIEKAKFRRQVRPEEEVRMVVTNLRIGTSMIRQAGKAYVGEELAAEAEWLCLVGNPRKKS